MAEEVANLNTPAHLGHLDAETRERLRQIDRDAEEYVRNNRPENTTDSYEADWKVWQRFCEETRLPELAVTSGTLVLFIEWAWQQPGRKAGQKKAPSSIRRNIAGICVTARSTHKLPLPRTISADARELLRRKEKAMEQGGEIRGNGKAPALLKKHMLTIDASLPRDRLKSIRDKAVMVTAFAVFGRESEVAALRIRDFQIDEYDRGAVLDLRVSKVSPRVVTVLYAEDESLCPVKAILTWIDAAGLAGAGPNTHLFRSLAPHSERVMNKGIRPRTVESILTHLGEIANLPVRFTGHSGRRGGATEAYRAGHDSEVIRAGGGWEVGSKAQAGYRELEDGWTENAMKGVL